MACNVIIFHVSPQAWSSAGPVGRASWTCQPSFPQVLFVKQDLWFFASFDLSKNLGTRYCQPLTRKERTERFHSIFSEVGWSQV